MFGSDAGRRGHMNHDDYSDAYLRDILAGARTIAVVGASPRPHRPSHGVMRFLQRHGYRAIPVNPFAAGGEILGERVYARLADIPEPIDMVDIFRRSELAGAAVDEAIAAGAKAVWMQLDVRDDAAAARAEARGIKVVMDRCPAIEIPRLGIAALANANRAAIPRAATATTKLTVGQRRAQPQLFSGLALSVRHKTMRR